MNKCREYIGNDTPTYYTDSVNYLRQPFITTFEIINFLMYVIAGFASLGLPGLSGFVAEMTIFIGSFEAGMADYLAGAGSLRLVFTLVACCSIVITAVYILRVVGKLLYGPVYNEHHRTLTDAEWWERLSTAALIVAVAAIGCFPNFFENLIKTTFTPEIFTVLGM